MLREGFPLEFALRGRGPFRKVFPCAGAMKGAESGLGSEWHRHESGNSLLPRKEETGAQPNRRGFDVASGKDLFLESGRLFS